MERRLSAIFAADMVGYSRLMEADEIGTIQRQKTHREQLINPTLEKYRGRIVKEMGDGLLVEFPSVIDALQCAVEIQRAMPNREAEFPAKQRIAYRIGINLGDIVVDGDDIYGDGVNVAARLEALAEPGGICISGTAQDTMRSGVDVGYESMGEVQVKNIERPIRAYKVLTNPDRAGTFIEKSRRHSATQYAFLTALFILFAIGAAGWLWSRQPHVAQLDTPKDASALHEGLSIAVLPFTNLSGDPDQEYFVDGMTDDLITDLSKLSSLFVIARNSVFAYKGRNIEPEKVAEELRVRYILSGSVRASGDRVRINSQLIDTQTGGQIWADRFDRPIGDIFSLQDDVTGNIVSALALKLTPEEENRINQAGQVTSPEVYDLYLRGVEALRQYTPESIATARSYFLEALSIDPDYARAYATTAFTYTAGGIFFRDDNIEDSLDKAIRYGNRALNLDPTLPQGHFAMAIAYLRLGQHQKALSAARNSVRYDPNYADGYVGLANVLMFMGQADEAIVQMEKAMELNPRYSAAYIDILGRAYFVGQDFERARSNLEECISRDPISITCHAFLAATQALMGNIADAEWEVEEVQNLEPGFTISSNSISPQFESIDARDLFDRGLALAGMSN